MFKFTTVLSLLGESINERLTERPSEPFPTFAANTSLLERFPPELRSLCLNGRCCLHRLTAALYQEYGSLLRVVHHRLMCRRAMVPQTKCTNSYYSLSKQPST